MVFKPEGWLRSSGRVAHISPELRLRRTGIFIMAGISQFERDLISQRTQEGLASARARGRNGGRPTKDKKNIDTAIKMYNSRLHSVAEIEQTTGVSKATLYRYLKK